LISGIKKNGCNPIPIDNYSSTTSQEILDSHLKNGCSVILHANRNINGKVSSHWNVCAGIKDNKYIIIDSAPLLANKKVISLYSWEEIVKRSIEYGEKENYFQLYGFAVQPPDSVSAVPRLHKYLNQLFKDQLLRENWGIYLKYLLRVFDTVGSAKNVIEANQFFAKYGNSFLAHTKDWQYEYSKSGVNKMLTYYKIVSDVYNLAVTEPHVDEALIRFTSALHNGTNMLAFCDLI